MGWFFEIAKRYYETEGKPFTSIDYLIRCMELYSLSSGDSISNLYNETGWYNSNNMIFKNAFMKFIDAILNKHIIISNLYSNTQVMSGEVASGIGSSASILYYNDVITYDDNTQEEMNLKVFKIPQANIDNPYVTQAGVGFIGHYTTPQKQEAMYEFVKWFTEINRNIEFVVSTGYMPVHNGSFNIIKDYDFEKDSYKNLYKVLEDIRESSNFVVEPSFTNYYQKVNTFNSYVKNIVSNIDEKLNKGATKESLKNEIWDFFIKLA